jgi:hypothetical protein
MGEEYCRNKFPDQQLSTIWPENKRIYTKKMDALMTRQDYIIYVQKNLCQRITSFLHWSDGAANCTDWM